MIPWIFLIALILVYSVTLPALLKRAGLKATLGYVPIANFFPYLKMIKRPWWWFFLLLCPGVNLLMLIVMNVELGIAFGKRSTLDQWKFGALPWYAIPNLAFKDKEATYVGPRDWTNKKKSFTREWGEAIVFAVVAASVIRTFFIEAFTIPTPSMEQSMLVGDYLFVSKMSYGAKIPQTPVSIPFVHNAIPGGMTNSYVDWFSLPYYRLPGFGEVERMDAVVFNFPNGDTIIVDPFYAGHDYYNYLRREGMKIASGKKNMSLEQAYNLYSQDPDKYRQLARNNFMKGICEICAEEKGYRKYPVQGIRNRPMDKKENYVKRCVGLPGENLKIVDRQVYINDQPIENPEGVMFSYLFAVNSESTLNKIYEEYKVNIQDRHTIRDNMNRTMVDSTGNPMRLSSFTQKAYEEIKAMKGVSFIQIMNDSTPTEPLAIYPNSPLDPFNGWTRDNFGPIHIPAEGETINLTPENIALYKRVIANYEGNEWSERDGAVFINGQPATTYTFKQNYYWMMGDNRHQSADSRYWGFVPEDHIVGKPVFTWFSKENKEYQEGGKVRWNRMFRSVH